MPAPQACRPGLCGRLPAPRPAFGPLAGPIAEERPDGAGESGARSPRLSAPAPAVHGQSAQAGGNPRALARATPVLAGLGTQRVSAPGDGYTNGDASVAARAASIIAFGPSGAWPGCAPRRSVRPSAR